MLPLHRTQAAVRYDFVAFSVPVWRTQQSEHKQSAALWRPADQTALPAAQQQIESEAVCYALYSVDNPRLAGHVQQERKDKTRLRRSAWLKRVFTVDPSFPSCMALTVS